ncbi:hypothetical protein KHQ82_03260 [Mycoplasmatota bacterium]|nr:hypothetical protein KHQ82_03260 [Mycoplasmatota bacterium]
MSVVLTAINCIDGRIQLPVIEYLKKEYKADFVDMVTEAGPNKILSENSDKYLVESIKARVELSLTRNESKLIAIVGHYDCKANPSIRDKQIIQIREAVTKVKEWAFDVPVIGLWVGDNWIASEIK